MLILNILNFLRTITILFFISVLGLILNRKNILITLISLELILLAVNINFTFFSIHLDDISFLFGMVINHERPIRKDIWRITIIDWKIDLSKKIIEMINEKINHETNSIEKNYNLISELKRLHWENDQTLQKLIKDKSVEIELIKLGVSIINIKIEKFTLFIEILTEELNALEKADPTISSNLNSDYSKIYQQNVKYKNRLASLKIDANYLENYLKNNPLKYISRWQSNLIYIIQILGSNPNILKMLILKNTIGSFFSKYSKFNETLKKFNSNVRFISLFEKDMAYLDFDFNDKQLELKLLGIEIRSNEKIIKAIQDRIHLEQLKEKDCSENLIKRFNHKISAYEKHINELQERIVKKFGPIDKLNKNDHSCLNTPHHKEL
jgi:hypothetical protein